MTSSINGTTNSRKQVKYFDYTTTMEYSNGNDNSNGTGNSSSNIDNYKQSSSHCALNDASSGNNGHEKISPSSSTSTTSTTTSIGTQLTARRNPNSSNTTTPTSSANSKIKSTTSTTIGNDYGPKQKDGSSWWMKVFQRSSSLSISTTSTNPSSTVLSQQQLQHKQQQQQLMIRRNTTRIVIGLCILYLIFLYQTQHLLNQHELFYGHGKTTQLIRGNTYYSQQQQQQSRQQTRQQQSRPRNKGKSNVVMLPLSPQLWAMEQINQNDNKKEQLVIDTSGVDNTNTIVEVTSNTSSTITTETELRRTLQQKQSIQQQVQQQSPSRKQQDPQRIDTTMDRNPRKYLQQIQKQIVEQKKLIDYYTMNTKRTKKKTTDDDDDLYIIFNADIQGQGNGNLVSGLLAAHLLGLEFNRIVCINPNFYQEFLNIFEIIDPIMKIKCPIIIQQQDTRILQKSDHGTLTIINFAGAADECEIQNIMLDQSKKVIYLIANTYPRWPTVPDHFFLYYYQPKSHILDALPYTKQPKTVVHLRQPDDGADIRHGLDDNSLNALSRMVPNDTSTFLVTNNVDYYHRFQQCCHWSHPKWEKVQHSALSFVWGTNHRSVSNEKKEKEEQSKQMWMDWYTILMADTVYHIHSDFSISAIHWMSNKNSYSIKGYNFRTNQLDTTIESWWYDGETIPIRQRTLAGKPNTTNELRACSLASRQITEKREQQEQHEAVAAK